MWLRMAAPMEQEPGNGTTQGGETKGVAPSCDALAGPVGFRGRSLGGHRGGAPTPRPLRAGAGFFDES
jgi:hypothetical protein